jgi:hydrogenase maturation protease
MKHILVLGYGNPLCSDDGVGWHAAQALANIERQANVEILACHQLLPELAESVGRFDRIIFVDASIDDRPGHISCRPITGQADAGSSLSHHLMPPALLAWSRELYDSEPEAVLITMGAESLDFGDKMTPSVSRKFSQLLDCIRDQIGRA